MLSVTGLWVSLLTLGGPPESLPVEPPAGRHYLVQIRIIEVDEQGRQTVVATPTLQTAGGAAGVSVDPRLGRRFEFHFQAIDPAQPAVAQPGVTERPRAIPEPMKADRMLTQRVSVSARQSPRKDILRSIADQAGLKLVLDAESVTMAAESLLMPISLELSDVAVDDALRQIIEPARLEYSVRENLVLIGVSGQNAQQKPQLPSIDSNLPPIPASLPPLPLEAAPKVGQPVEGSWTVKIYDVSDLVQLDEATGTPRFAPLISELRQQVTPSAWEAPGGASIRGFDSSVSLVVRQTPAGHAAVASFLKARRTPRSEAP
jgi:hypothetical protein